MRARVEAMRYLALCGIIFGFTQAHAASMSEMPPALKKTAECMLKVLKTVPGVTEAKLGISKSEGWTHPYLTYRPLEKNTWIQPTRFDVLKQDDLYHGPYAFQADLPGLVPLGGKLDNHVTESVVREWKLHCKVDAWGLFG